MRVIRAEELARSGEFFRVLETTDRSQLAVMVLGDGDTSGEYGTDHPQSDQIILVLEGSGSLVVEGEETPLSVGDIAVIPAGAKHQVRGPNRTLSFYAPVAYPDE